VADSDNLGKGVTWRVFVSHTSELRDFPPGMSYVAAVERAVSAAGHVIVNMADFPASDQPPAELCIDRVRGCDVYIGVLGTRYGSPVRDRPEMSYTELEFLTASDAGLARLVFLLDTEAADVGIPLSRLIDHEFGARQEVFRRRVRDSALVTPSFASPAALGQLVERSLRELAETQQRRDGTATATDAALKQLVIERERQRAEFEQRKKDATPALEGHVVRSGGNQGTKRAQLEIRVMNSARLKTVTVIVPANAPISPRGRAWQMEQWIQYPEAGNGVIEIGRPAHWDVDVTGIPEPFMVLAIAHGDYGMKWDRCPVRVVFDS
jgi:hypothetical protein